MKAQMRKPSYSEIYMYKSLFWFSIITFIFCPIFNNSVLKVLISGVGSDIAYEWLLLPLLICQAILSLVPLYAGYGALAFAIIYFGSNAKGIIKVAFISIPVELISLLLGELIASHGIESLMGTLVSAITVGLALTVVYVLVSLYAKKKNTYMNVDRYTFSAEMLSHPYTKASLIACATYAALHTVAQVINMVIYFNDPTHYSEIPGSIGEILVTYVLPYVQILLFAAIGFVVMLLVGVISQKFKDSGKKKYLMINKKSAE